MLTGSGVTMSGGCGYRATDRALSSRAYVSRFALSYPGGLAEASGSRNRLCRQDPACRRKRARLDVRRPAQMRAGFRRRGFRAPHCTLLNQFGAFSGTPLFDPAKLLVLILLIRRDHDGTSIARCCQRAVFQTRHAAKGLRGDW